MHSEEGRTPDQFEKEIDRLVAGTSEFKRGGFDFTGFLFRKSPEGLKNWECQLPVSFDRAQFFAEVSFEGSSFRQRVSFQRTAFHNPLTLTNVRFGADATFANCNLGRIAAKAVHFGGLADFSSASISLCDFSGSVFLKKASFLKAEFGGSQASFREARFLDGATFTAAKVSRELDFSGATFEAIDDGPCLDLQHLRFPGPASEVILSGSNTNSKQGLRVALLGTDIAKLSIPNVHWFRERSRLVLWDEIALRKRYARDKAPEHSYEQAANVYRQLKKSFDHGLDHGNAEDCASGVMEMKRHDRRESWPYRRALGIYKFASLYGTNFWRALLVLLAIPTLCGLLFSIPGVNLQNRPDREWTLDPAVWQPTLTSFIHAFEVATFQREQKYPAENNPAHIIGMVESVLVPGQLALFLLALKRRMKR